jgi:hypothetical protein
MCWYSSNKEDFEPKVATEDIPVIKVVLKEESDKYISVYYAHPYQVGDMCESSIVIEGDDYETRISQGLHSYSKDVVLSRRKLGDTSWKPSSRLYIDSPDHIWVLDSFVLKEDMAKLNCIIPKDSVYYVNECGEYVSNRLKVVSAEPIKEE